tara:strand:+ start:36928 stop:39156 length:2229 start_codon:yes stop_codon:yes gene_type:complete
MGEKGVSQVRKRDGSIVLFNHDKIKEAIFKAAKSVGGDNSEISEDLSNKVVDVLNQQFGDITIPTVEQVSDIVERILIKHGYVDTSKAFILYRFKHKEIRNVKESVAEAVAIIDNYVSQADWRVKENSNMAYSLQGLNNHITSTLVAKYWLDKLYPEEISSAHQNGDIHIHDLGVLGPYCVGWDIKDILMSGFGGVSGKTESKPPKHLKTALGQIVNFFYTLQGESAGAQALSNFDTYLAPFIKSGNLSYKEIKQAMQEFLFNMNVPTRTGFQTPFTNITMDLKVPDFIKNEPIIIGGKLMTETYGSFQKEMDLINKAFAEVMMEGDAKGRVFTFPIPTYNITKDFDWDNEDHNIIWEMTAKYGIPYFSNFINSDMKPDDVRSMCCRLRLDNKELEKRGGGLFGSNPLTGSLGVVTVNLVRIGYLSKNEQDYFERLEKYLDLAKKSLEMKRKSLERFTEAGLYPYSRFFLRHIYQKDKKYWVNHFSTIGILGMNESLLNFLGCNIASESGRVFTIKVLNFIRKKLSEYQQETGNLYNLEASPAEGASYRFSKKDKNVFPRIIVGNEDDYRDKGAAPYYTNSTQLPINYTNDIFEALELQDEIQCKYTGGTVLHGFIGERISSPETTKMLVKKIANNFKLPYFTLTPTFSICPKHGYLNGEKRFCPKCDSLIENIEENLNKRTRCEVYSRVVGYLRPVQQWNTGKRAEFFDRKVFDEEQSLSHPIKEIKVQNGNQRLPAYESN